MKNIIHHHANVLIFIQLKNKDFLWFLFKISIALFCMVQIQDKSANNNWWQIITYSFKKYNTRNKNIIKKQTIKMQISFSCYNSSWIYYFIKNLKIFRILAFANITHFLKFARKWIVKVCVLAQHILIETN